MKLIKECLSMAGIQQAVSSLATGLAYARKVREYGSMQKANVQVQQQRLALQKQKMAIAEHHAQTQRKLANARLREVRLKEKSKTENDDKVMLGGQKVSLKSLNPKLATLLKGGNK